jgi:hypothetical protein
MGAFLKEYKKKHGWDKTTTAVPTTSTRPATTTPKTKPVVVDMAGFLKGGKTPISINQVDRLLNHFHDHKIVVFF